MREILTIESIGTLTDVHKGLDQKFPVAKVISWLTRYDIEAKKIKSLEQTVIEMTRNLAFYKDDFILIQGDGLEQPKVPGWIGVSDFKPDLLISAFAQYRIDDLFLYHPGLDQFYSAQTEEYNHLIITKTSKDFIDFKK
ncbi:MAG: hypothetical protein AAGB26_11890 [Planctomycetota bacterium]